MLKKTPSITKLNPFASANQITMADLIELIIEDGALRLKRRRDLASSIRSFALVLGLNPSEIPANHWYYRERIKRIHPKQQARISKKRWQNIKSDVSFALRHMGIAEQQPRHLASFTPAWRQLADKLTNLSVRYGLSRFMHYCSAQSILPRSVDDQVLQAFLGALRRESFVGHPERLHRMTCWLWNQAAESVPGWPQIRLTVPCNRKTYCLAWEDLPKPFRQDAEAWLAQLAGSDPLATDGPLKPATEATIKSYRFRIRQLVSALALRGHDISTFTSLRDLVKVETAKEALRFFLERNGNESSSQIAGLASTLRNIAKHWCKVDDQQFERLQQIKSRLAVRKAGLSSKNRERLRQFTDRRNLEALLCFPQDIYERVRHKAKPTITDAWDMQIALAVELLLMMPIRRANLVALSLEWHIKEWHIKPTRRGPNAVVHVVIPGEEVKNGQNLDFPLPPETSGLLYIYIRNYRPLLADGPSEWLFPGDKPGRHKSLDGFSHHFSKTLYKYTGLKMNMHLMRHLGAKLYLDENPGAYEVVRRVLGHRSLSTTLDNYTGLETEAAIRHFDTVILGIKNRIRKETEDD